tara:strand:+ start:234 stop:461 length:228 start_codon:yes stop_codon:yes gene_type:complete
MKKIIIFLLSFCSFVFAQSYCAGDQINIDDQNTNFEVCYSSGNYQIGDSWSLSDVNGDLNGGNYYITFVDLAATW